MSLNLCRLFESLLLSTVLFVFASSPFTDTGFSGLATTNPDHNHEVLNSPPRQSWMSKFIDPEVIVPLLVVISTGLFWIYRKSEEERQELGRYRFLEIMGTKVEDILLKEIKPHLTKINTEIDQLRTFADHQKTRSKDQDDMYNQVKRRVDLLEQSLTKHFARVEYRLDHTFSKLPCINKVDTLDHEELVISPCSSNVELESNPYPRFLQNHDELD